MSDKVARLFPFGMYLQLLSLSDLFTIQPKYLLQQDNQLLIILYFADKI